MVFGATEEDEPFARSSRPVSWHPLSSDAFGLDSTENLNSDSTAASPASGYASAPAMAYLTALAERKKEQYSVPGLSNADSSQDQHMAGSTYSSRHTPNPRIESASSDFLAESTDYMDPDSKEGDVLVGMGLYDPPNYESMLTSGFGKGLKLQETWQPPEDAEDSSDDESADEPAEQTKPISQRYWSPPTTQTTTSGSMYVNEWYHQLKRPTAHATGLGYGWLQPVQY